MEEEFARCTADRAAERDTWKLKGVSRENKMTDEEVSNLYSYMQSTMKNVNDADGLFIYETLKKIMDGVLCRFPRPSELSRLSKYFNVKNARFFYANVPIVATDPQEFSRLVGKNGANFRRHTQKWGLLYMWMHRVPNKPLERTLHLYAVDRQNIVDCVPNILNDTKVKMINSRVTPTIKSLDTMDNSYLQALSGGIN